MTRPRQDLRAVRLIAITDLSRCDGPALIERVRALAAAVPAGAFAVQLRAKDRGGAAVHAAAVALRAIAGVALVVNDRVDVALAVDADGVHLPEAGLSIAATRALVGTRWLGVSRHAAAAVAGVDAVQLGPVAATPGKGPPLPLAAVTAQARHGPVVAVGGIDGPAPAEAAAAAGADAVAAIRALWDATDPRAVAQALVAAVERGRGMRSRPRALSPR